MGTLKILNIPEVFEAAFSSIKLDGLDPLFFAYGDDKELNSVLTTREYNQMRSYPLLWLVMPYEAESKFGQANGRFRFLIAENTEVDDRNDQRFKGVYKETLFPYANEFLSTIQKASNVYIPDDARLKWTDRPNYTDKQLNATEMVDFWDVVQLDIDLVVHEDKNC